MLDRRGTAVGLSDHAGGTTMSETAGSMTERICELRAGRNVDDAARAIWDRYFEPLVRLARARLRDLPGAMVGEEDVALSTLDCLCRGLPEGRYPGLSGRDDLFRLMVTITARKAANRIRDESRGRRGGGRVVDERALDAEGDGAGGLAALAGREPPPESAAIFAGELGRLLAALPSDEHKAIAALKLEEYTDREIADRLGLGLRTVERKLAVIRSACNDPTPH